MDPTWEYLVLKQSSRGWYTAGMPEEPNLEMALNTLGRQGWELVGCGGEFYFKRLARK